VNPLKAESLGRHRWSCLGPIALCNDAIDIRWLDPASPSLEERSHQDADHVVQESTARNIETHDAWLRIGDRATKYGAHRGLALIGLMRERPKVMRSNDARGGSTHTRKIHRVSTNGRETALEWCGTTFESARAGAIRNAEPIAVRLAHATSHWIEGLIDLIGPDHFEITRQPGVERHRHAIDRNTKLIDAERSHLAARVHARIGSACTEHRDRCPNEIVNRLGEDALRRAEFRKVWRNLPLPAVEVGAVVRDQEAQSRHGSCSAQ